MIEMNRLSDPQVSPDGAAIAYVLSEYDEAANRRRSDLFVQKLGDKSAAQRVAADPENDSSPRWGKDGSLYFLSGRSGSTQVWRLAKGAEKPERITDLPLDVANLAVAPKGGKIAYTIDVFQDCSDLDCTVGRMAANKARQTTGMVYDRLFVRHWDAWEDGLRTHVFTQDAVPGAKPVDLSKSLDGDVAAAPFGDSADIAFAPDGKTIFFALRLAGHDEAWSTNYDIYRVPVDGAAAPENLTADNTAYDGRPLISPDGKTLAYLSMRTPGYESDRKRVVLHDLKSGKRRVLTEGWDRSVASIAFAEGGKMLLATAEDLGQQPLWRIPLRTGEPVKLTKAGSVSDISVAGDGDAIYFTLSDLSGPNELYRISLTGEDMAQLSHVNRGAEAQVRLSDYQQFSFPGWRDETVYGYVMKPANFQEGKKYPLIFIIHGGPQGSFANAWSFRWNPQIYASAGYGVVFIDFHGSTGYGQDFTDSITQNWGSGPLEDWKKGLAAAVEQFSWLDGDNACAMGGSYGGYSMNWIAGHWPDRFKCLVTHAGVFDTRFMSLATEELWFVEHDNGGPYWENPDAYEKYNPIRFIEAWRTPTLVTQGGKDYRVPETQSLALFNALQRRGIPSRLLYFPDENHWISNPANSRLWHREVLDWFAKWLPESPSN